MSVNRKDIEDPSSEEEKLKQQVGRGKQLSEELNARFAEWYYVISDDSFDRIRLKRGDLVKKT